MASFVIPWIHNNPNLKGIKVVMPKIAFVGMKLTARFINL
jgi:hypothetical protein